MHKQDAELLSVCGPGIWLVRIGVKLANDSDLWLKGTNDAVRVVIICKMFYPNGENKIKATLTLSRMWGDRVDIVDWV